MPYARILPCLLAWVLVRPALAAELPEEARSVWAELDAVDTVKARFEQVQHRRILSKPLVSTGTLAFARPAQVRWEMETPVRSVFVMSGSRVSTSMPDFGHSETMDLAASPEATRLVRGLMVWLGGDLAEVERDYEVAWTSGPPHLAVLTPRDPALEQILKQIELTIGGAPPAVQRVVLHEPSGDRVEITFRDIALGGQLPPETFSTP